MANTLSNEEIKKINELYQKYKSYAAVARETGRAASTVKKYVIKDFIPEEKRVIKRFDLSKDMPEFSTAKFLGIENFSEICYLSDEEKEEMKELWEEMDL